MRHLTNEQLITLIAKKGKEACSGSNPRHLALEKERALLVRELMRRGLGGYPSKAKYRNR